MDMKNEFEIVSQAFWGFCFGAGKDRFGINWMINVDLRDSSA